MSATLQDDDARRHHDKLVEWALSDAGRAIIELDRHLVRTQGLKAFCPLAWPVIEGAKTFQSNWHLDAIFDYLEAVSRGEIKRLAIAIPPRCMKSLSSAIMWPAWDWIDNSWRRFLFSSYAHNLAIRDSVRCRRVVQSDWYQLRWGDRFRLVGDQNTKVRFENSSNGYRLSTSVDGQLTGEGGDVIVCFPADQQVLTENGPIDIGKIVKRRMAVRVWSYDTTTGHTALKPVIGWHKNPGRPIVRVVLGDGTSFRCTPDHQIWTTRGWVRADGLLPTDVLPRPAVPDVGDGLAVDMKSRSKHPVTLGAFDNHSHILLSQDAIRGSLANRTVGWADKSPGDINPCLPSSDLPDRSYRYTVPLAERLGGLGACCDLLCLVAGKDRPRASFMEGEGAVSLGVGDILPARPIGEIDQPSIVWVSVEVPDLLSSRRRSDECQHHNLVHEQRMGFPVAPRIEARITLPRRGLNDAARDFHGLTAALSGARFAPNMPEVGDEICGEVGDRSPVLIELVGHVDATFCLTVADYHTMMLNQHGNVIARNCDDPHNVRQAESETTRENTLTWWDEAMSSRLNDPKNGAYVLIQQRVHERDLMGHVMTKETEEEWTYLCLPMEFEPDHPHRWFRDPRKEVGELLWPSRVGPREVRSLKTRLGPYAAAAQLQQRPAPREGGIFKRGWFKTVPVAPSDTRWVRGWDLAATEKKLIKSDPDYTASVMVGWSGSAALWYIGHVERFREDPHEVERRLEQRAEADGIRVQIQLPQDPGQAGKSQAQNLIRKLSKFTVSAVPVTGDKMSRAMAWAGKAGAGLVALVKGDWNDMFLDEVTGFPTAAHDDMVDAASAAFERLVDSTYGIADWYEQMLRANGVDPSTLKPPHVVLAEQEAARKEMNEQGTRVASSESTDFGDMMRSLYGKKPT